MEQHGKYRHELKYSITPAEYMALRGRLGVVMQPDPHTGPASILIISAIRPSEKRSTGSRCAKSSG